MDRLSILLERPAVDRTIGKPDAETRMLGEVLGDNGRPVRFQIARSAHHNVAPRDPQWERDHVDRHKV
ncbi:hypothetical protein D3C87_1891700 [compost metagenome]